MSDGIAITAGAGTTILTDDTGAGGHAQVMKLAISTDGSGTLIPADATNGLDVDVTRLPASVSSTVNSSTATLTSGSVFTGTSESVKDYALIQVSVIASHASATDGLSLQQSSDGTNWDFTDTYTVPAATGKVFSVQPASVFFRIVYTNGGTGQSSFRLKTVFHYASSKSSSQRPQDARSNENDFEEVSAFNHLFNGTSWDRARGDTTTGTYVGGAIAHDGVDSGNPVKIGYRAIAHGSNPTAVAAADRSDALCNRAGIPFAIGGHPNIVTVKHTTITTAVTDAAIITVSTGLRIVVTSFTVTLDNASTVFPTVLIGFGTANTPTTTGVIGAHGGVPAGGGFSRGDGSGIIGIGADNEDLRVTTTGNATGNGLQIVVGYYTIES